jgi:hypothetical protein
LVIALGRHKSGSNAALGHVFAAMDLDVVIVVEAPDSSRRRDATVALEHFAQWLNLRARKAVVGFENTTQQEIALLYEPDVVSAVHDPRDSETAPRFDGTFAIDVDTDAAPDQITWSKPPLEIALTIPTGRVIRLIGVHAKSKAPHGARNDAEASRMSIENRRKQLAQCIWLRKRVDAHLEAGDDLIVLGDFNDGPGLDEYEKLFGRSGVEIVLGEGDALRMFDPHARIALGQRMGRNLPPLDLKNVTGPIFRRCLTTLWCRRGCAILALNGRYGIPSIILHAMTMSPCTRRC